MLSSIIRELTVTLCNPHLHHITNTNIAAGARIHQSFSTLSKTTNIAYTTHIGPRLQNWKAVKGQFKPELESESIDILKDYQPELQGHMYECNNKPNQKKSGTSTEMEFMCRMPLHYTVIIERK